MSIARDIDLLISAVEPCGHEVGLPVLSPANDTINRGRVGHYPVVDLLGINSRSTKGPEYRKRFRAFREREDWVALFALTWTVVTVFEAASVTPAEGGWMSLAEEG